MPAAAVIPAPIVYIKVVAVKKFVVSDVAGRSPFGVRLAALPLGEAACLTGARGSRTFTLRKLECSKQA